MWTLGDLSSVVWLLLNWFEGLGVRRFLLHFDHIWGAGLGCRGEATQNREGRSAVRVKPFSLQLGLCQEHLSPLHLLLQLVIVGLENESRCLLTHCQQSIIATVSKQGC